MNRMTMVSLWAAVMVFCLICGLSAFKLVFTPVALPEPPAQYELEILLPPAGENNDILQSALTERGLSVRGYSWRTFPEFYWGMGVIALTALSGAILSALKMLNWWQLPSVEVHCNE
ncbi:MAG: hypothetical protein A2Z70_01345 [Chloroflexi bacterium RBG_13_48_17]|nr:MAG: hypothetical protein A2Z70_01345 [Chloroflexi bacterium RBG_13_48_17]